MHAAMLEGAGETAAFQGISRTGPGKGRCSCRMVFHAETFRVVGHTEVI
jgi:hypothetical protein